MMKKISLALSFVACLALPAMAAPLEGLKFEQQKQQVVKDVKQNCPDSSGMSDAAFANHILDSAQNKQAVQTATRALDKNDRAGYEKAIREIQCPAK